MEIKIKRSEFLKDYEELSVEDIKEKYSLNNRSYYKLVDMLNLPRRRPKFQHKKIVILED